MLAAVLYCGLALHPNLGGATASAQAVDSLLVRPINPALGERVAVWLRGVWPTSCTPRFTRAVEQRGGEILIYVSASAHDPPPSACTLVQTPYVVETTFEPEAAGWYDLEIYWVDSPFLPSLLTRGDVYVQQTPSVLLRPSAELSPSDPARALLFGTWPAGCAPRAGGVRTVSDRVVLRTVFDDSRCEPSQQQPFALLFDLPALDAGPWDLAWIDDLVDGDGVSSPVERFSLPLSVAPGRVETHLLDGAFEVRAAVRLAEGAPMRPARVASTGSEQSAFFYFLGPENLEIQVKVLDGCSLNGHFWVFGAANSDLEFSLRVRQVATGAERVYEHSGGSPAHAINDTTAFTGCGG
ncbi:MAG: hypothetical protein DWQ36_08680 [Acidobacteria bacterium]|nr:MAG: hypothetical protein DWQ36_08680 [Acidobacteriota bacterium]